MDHKPVMFNRSANEWLSSLPVFMLLILTLVIGTGEMIHGQLLRMGERFFGDPTTGVQYFMLRADPVKPTDCDPNVNIEAELQKQLAAPTQPASDVDSLFADDAPTDPEALRQSLLTAQTVCKEKFANYENGVKLLTPSLKAFRAFETAFFSIFKFGTENRPVILILMVAIAAITTTLSRHHIALRPPKTRIDFQVYAVSMVIASTLLLASTISYWKLERDTGLEVELPIIDYIWGLLFVSLIVISIYQFFNPPKDAPTGGTVSMGLLAVPIFATMAMITGTFFLSLQHYSGLAIYLGKMKELSGMFLNLSLYIWCGMLLKQTRVVDMFLNIFRPWKFSPEVLTYIILLGAAIPTAYTGASGIFVIAAGAVIYREVLGSGANRQYALAATVMSGSLGVVLNPCLLVVIIAAMNKEVTTTILYSWGSHVFLLTSTLFLIVSLIATKEKFRLARPKTALPGSARAFANVSPYIAITAIVIGAYRFLLDTKLDEFTSSMILPFILLAIVWFDKIRREPKTDVTADVKVAAKPEERRIGFEEAVRVATNETIGHIGALIMLMGLSLCVGGFVERAELMSYAPQHFANVWMAMTFLVVVKVLLGMVMDPFGAVILVSSTLAPIAYANGIDPVHFWMMVLVAFELGYLLPPVALNQLLARQVIGEEEITAADAEVKHLGFYRRYERWNLPVIVMTIGMLIVAYAPLFFYAK